MFMVILAISMAAAGQTAELNHVDSLTQDLNYPGRITPTAGGGVYVTDQPSGRIVEYDAGGAVVNVFAIAGGPVGVAVLNGDVFVSRADGKVGLYDGSFASLGVLNPAPFVFVGPNDMDVDPVAGELYVVDGPGHRILVFGDVGGMWTVVRAWGMQGTAAGQMEWPLSIAVDTVLHRVLVTDADNFRVQVFDTSGALLFKFGYRIAFTSTTELAWLARGAGIAVDSCSNIYVSDALMGTVRVFDAQGHDLDLLSPPIGFGTGGGQLRVPCDVMIRGNTAYVASTNNASVEVFEINCAAAPAPGMDDVKQPATAAERDRQRDTRRAIALHGPRAPDNPFELAATVQSGAFDERHDLNLDGRVDDLDLTMAVEAFGMGTVADFLPDGPVAAAQPPSFAGPHIVEGLPNQCGRCHDMDGAPGGMTSLAGQANLCQSCHTGSGLANTSLVPDPTRGNSHPMGVPADMGISDGPDPNSDSEMIHHLDGGDIRCGTCHNQHNQQQGEPYLRGTLRNAQLCGECHREAAGEWMHAGHADESADPFTHYDWALPSRAACRKCHSGNGYIDFAAGKPDAQQNGAFRVLDCAVCHGVHGALPGEDLLRIYDDITLPGDVTFHDQGSNATCMTCHNGRAVPADAGLTPHYALGGVMFEGINAVDFGATIQNSAHTSVAMCVSCHMAPGPAAGEPGAGKIGGHSFALRVHDPADPDYGVENIDHACNSTACHGNTGPLDMINRTAYGDYDGDGMVEGVQDEVGDLMDLVFNRITAAGAVFLGGYPYWNLNAVVDDPPGYKKIVEDAIWNWEYVDNSGDFGIHNTGYAVGILQVTYEQLAGAPLAGAELRYTPPGFGPTVVEILQINDGNPVQPGGAFTVDFTIEDENGVAIEKADLNRLILYVSGPTSNFQRVIGGDSNLARFTQNPDGSYTYAAATPFPSVYLAPLNDSPAFDAGDGELTGQPLVDGTYTVLLEARRVFGAVRKAGDATVDFVVSADVFSPPPLESRELVTRTKCNDCHNDLQLHGGQRFSTTGCVVCHTNGAEDRITNPPTTVGTTIEFADMVHHIHRGIDLPSVRATADGADPYRYALIGFGNAVIDFSDVGFPPIPAGVRQCDACHGGAAQGEAIYDRVTRSNCTGCHEDLEFNPLSPRAGLVLDEDHAAFGTLTVADLDDPAYRVAPGGVTHAFIDDTGCASCHEAADVKADHTHPTSPDDEGTAPAIDIVAVNGMTGGGGIYFVAGDFPRITFKLRNSTADPVPLLPGDRSIADRIDFIVAGPTALYQTIMTGLRPWNNGNRGVPAANWIDNFAVDGTYTFISATALPAVYPAQANSIGDPPADQIFAYAGGWGQQYSPGGTPLDAGTYSVFGYGRRITPVAGEREPIRSDRFDIPFGADEPIVPYNGTVTTASCNACHGVLAFHGNQREGVELCLACHTAGTQDGATSESVDLRIMVHKLHNARNLDVVAGGGRYELNGNSGVADFSHLLISSMPGAAAECRECHSNDVWKTPPARTNMRSWMVACTSCHDGADTLAHVNMMTLPGTFNEQCVNCHGPGRLFAVETVHASP